MGTMQAQRLAATKKQVVGWLLIGRATRTGSDVSDYVYPGDGHLFFDDGLPEEYDRVAAGLLDVRALGFLSRFDTELVDMGRR